MDRAALTYDTAAVAAPRKAARGQFFTTANPFDSPAFAAWLDSVPAAATLLEPFAGANNLVRMLDGRTAPRTWVCFDIEPRDPAVAARDTIAAFPRLDGPVAVITNPPYLAKNVARRRGLHAAADLCGAHDNLYQVCVERCLANAGWVAAIVPESFLGAGVFRARLEAVVSLDRPMFEDTDVPVCLALWGPGPRTDFDVWKGDERLGSWAQLRRALDELAAAATQASLVFNHPLGQLGLIAVDSPAGATIRFCPGGEIPSGDVKPTSRHKTRIRVDGLADRDVPRVVAAANARLADVRSRTRDVALTAFMGLRHDRCYRRRLRYALARTLLLAALADTGATGAVGRVVGADAARRAA